MFIDMIKHKIKKGQVWKQKQNGILLLINGKSGSGWHGSRVGMGDRNGTITHHITDFMLYKKWELTALGTKQKALA